MMNSASRSFSGVAGTMRTLPSAFARGHVRRDVEGVAQLVRHDDRADVLEIAQLDDLVVHRRRGDRIEAGRRLVVQENAAA